MTSPPAGGPPGGDQPPDLATESANLLRLHGALTLSSRKYKTLFELAPAGYLYL